MTRQRRIALAIAGAAAAIALAAVLLLGGGEDGPPDTLAALVPSGALVYAHLSTDPAREEDARFARRRCLRSAKSITSGIPSIA